MTAHVPFLRSVYPDTKLIGAEIGVFEGEGAVRLCTELKFNLLYLIDPYLIHEGYTDYAGYNQSEWGDIEFRMRTALNINSNGDGVYNGQPIKHLKMMSVDAAKEIDDGSLDFVYLDGNHDYSYVKTDLETWYGKVKVGGWIMGHDWPRLTVQKAVNEFIQKRNIKFHPKSGHLHGTHDWWFRR